MKRLASMEAECVELVNLDMAAVQRRTVRRSSARQYWCQMLRGEKKNPATYNMFQWKGSFCLSLPDSLTQRDDFELFVYQNVAFL